MADEKCDKVCETLASINHSLINVVVDRLAEVLEHINSSLEMSGKVNEHVIEELKKVSLDVIKVREIVGDNSLKEISSTLNNLDIIRDKDKEEVVDFVQRITMAVGRWSPEERTAVVEFFEDSGKVLITTKRRFKKIYFILFGAGITTILSQLDIPEWAMKVLNALIAG